jgi:hypothetical protein
MILMHISKGVNPLGEGLGISGDNVIRLLDKKVKLAL